MFAYPDSVIGFIDTVLLALPVSWEYQINDNSLQFFCLLYNLMKLTPSDTMILLLEFYELYLYIIAC